MKTHHKQELCARVEATTTPTTIQCKLFSIRVCENETKASQNVLNEVSERDGSNILLFIVRGRAKMCIGSFGVVKMFLSSSYPAGITTNTILFTSDFAHMSFPIIFY